MWSNKNIFVIICNDADSKRSRHCGKTEWFAKISYKRGKEIFKNTSWSYIGYVTSAINGDGEMWHTFNQEDAEKYTLGDFKCR